MGMLENALTSNPCPCAVQVVDNFPPVARCRDITVSLDDRGLYELKPEEINNGSTDNCEIVFSAVNRQLLTCTDTKEPQRVMLNVYDRGLLSSSCEARVTVLPSPACAGQCENPCPTRQIEGCRTGLWVSDQSNQTYSLVLIEGAVDIGVFTNFVGCDGCTCTQSGNKFSCTVQQMQAITTIRYDTDAGSSVTGFVGSCPYSIEKPINTLVQYAESNPELSTAVELLNTANLTQTVNRPRPPFTIFFPTNTAFTNANLVGLSSEQLQSTLLYHVVGGQTIQSTQLHASPPYNTLSGSTIEVRKSSSGVVSVEDGVATTVDIPACNGVGYILDRVLIPPCSNSAPLSNVLSLAQNTPSLSKFVELGFDKFLPAEHFTVTAPTNDAFDAISEMLVNATQAEIDKILQYHIQPDLRWLTSEMPGGGISLAVLTVEGSPVDLTQENSTVKVNGNATVVQANNQGCDGIIQIIDKV